MKITKEDLKKLIKEVTATELALQQALAADRKRNPQAGPDLEDVPSLYNPLEIGSQRQKAAIDKLVDTAAGTAPGDTQAPPVKDPRPVRVASTDPASPNHLRKKINALHASGRISRETKIAARRALHGKGGKYDPEMGVEAAMAILRDAGVRIDLKEASKVASDTLEEMVRGEIAKQRLTKIVREEFEAVLSESDAMKDKAARAVWELYSQDKAARPDVRHPDGEAKEKRLTAKRQKKRLATGKARDDG